MGPLGWSGMCREALLQPEDLVCGYAIEIKSNVIYRHPVLQCRLTAEAAEHTDSTTLPSPSIGTSIRNPARCPTVPGPVQNRCCYIQSTMDTGGNVESHVEIDD